MPELNDLNEDSPAKLSRRNVVVGTAWAVPAIALVGAAPAMALSGDSITINSIAVSPLATGASFPTRTINAATAPSATVIVKGSVTIGRGVTVTFDSGSVGATVAADGQWSATIPHSAVNTWTNGTTYTFGARVNEGLKPATTETFQLIKDTALPQLAVGTPGGSGNSGSVTFTPGSAPGDLTVTADNPTHTTNNGANDWTVTGSISTTPTPTYSWSATKGTGNLRTVTVVLRQKDTAGNETTRTIVWNR